MHLDLIVCTVHRSNLSKYEHWISLWIGFWLFYGKNYGISATTTLDAPMWVIETNPKTWIHHNSRILDNPNTP